MVDAAKTGKILSKDDFRDRTKVSKTVIDLMDDLKLLRRYPAVEPECHYLTLQDEHKFCDRKVCCRAWRRQQHKMP